MSATVTFRGSAESNGRCTTLPPVNSPSAMTWKSLRLSPPHRRPRRCPGAPSGATTRTQSGLDKLRRRPPPVATGARRQVRRRPPPASTWSPLTYLTAASTVRANTPTVMTVHSMWSYASPLFGLADTAVGWSHWPIAWSAVSSTAAGPMQRVLGLAAQVAVLPNGVDTAAWTTAGRRVSPHASSSRASADSPNASARASCCECFGGREPGAC